MHNDEVEEVYDFVIEGTDVEIVKQERNNRENRKDIM
ncbi:MAG: L,D-transpeptidase [Candidatus Theseobacter exili]|nr:L,D-transpeptidase [Candidatus Theseobacter exili]